MLKISNKNLHLTAIYWQKWLRDKNLKMYQNLVTSFLGILHQVIRKMKSLSQKEASLSIKRYRRGSVRQASFVFSRLFLIPDHFHFFLYTQALIASPVLQGFTWSPSLANVTFPSNLLWIRWLRTRIKYF